MAFLSGFRNRRTFGRRYGLKGRDRVSFLANTIVGTTRQDRGWADDELEIWGYTYEIATDGSGSFPTMVVNAGGLVEADADRDCYIRRLDFVVTGGFPQSIITGATVHLARAFPTYPTDDGGSAGEWFPAQFPGEARSSGVRLPTARVTTGLANALQSAFVGSPPVLISPLLGPRYQTKFHEYNTGVSRSRIDEDTTIIDWNDPPLFVPAGQRFMVQWYNAVAVAGWILRGNVWLSEREQVA